MNAPAKHLASLVEALAAPLPAFIQADQIAASLRMYRYRPEQIAELLDAIADAMHNEHYRHDGELSDMLADKGGEITDTATDLRTTAETAEETEVCNCRACDSCVAARSDEHYDRRRDGMSA
jgi:hypothetical protein